MGLYARRLSKFRFPKAGAYGLLMAFFGSSVWAFAAMLGGLLVLPVSPVAGVPLTLGGMALLLHAAARLREIRERGKAVVKDGRSAHAQGMFRQHLLRRVR